MAISDKIKQAIRKEYKYKCQYCEDPDRNAKHIEHIIAKDNNGTDDLENLTLSCERCNFKKANLELPEQYAGILIARAKKKKIKIEGRIANNSNKKRSRVGNTPSDFFIKEFANIKVKPGDKFLKINTNEEQIKNFIVLFKQQQKIVHNSDGEGYIEYQTYKWNSLLGEQFHNIFKTMMYVNIDKVKYTVVEDNIKFQKIGSENLITGIFYGVNEYVKIYLSERLIELIKNNTIFNFKDILYGKEIKYNPIKQLKKVENPFL